MPKNDPRTTNQHPDQAAESARHDLAFKQPLSRWSRAFLVGTAALFLALGALFFIWWIARPIALFLLALTIATALLPIVHFLERFLRRTPAVVLVFLSLLLVFILIGFVVIPPLVEQVQSVGTRLPELLEQADAFLRRWLRVGNIDFSQSVRDYVAESGPMLVALPVGALYGLLEIVLVLFMALYMLVEAPAIYKFALSLVPERQREGAAKVLDEMAHSMGGYVRGILISGSAVAVMAFFGTWALGLNYPLALAVFAGVMEILPYVGPTIAGIPIVLLAFAQSPTTGLIAVIFWLAVQQIESNILLPNIMRSQTEVSPLLVLLALTAGYGLGGLMGAIVAIPVTAALRVFFIMVVAPAIRRRTGARADRTSRVKVEHQGKE